MKDKIQQILRQKLEQLREFEYSDGCILFHRHLCIPDDDSMLDTLARLLAEELDEALSDKPKPPPPQIPAPHTKQPLARVLGPVSENSNEARLGEMRLGGMQPSAVVRALPSKFYITSVLVYDTESPGTITLICGHGNTVGEEIEWITQDTIMLNGKPISLIGTPSYRANWSTFTISKADWIE